MREVPEFVRQRIAQAPPGEHPDADVLAAFAENSLPQLERSQVLEHLGCCATCRDVVALALPAEAGPRAESPAARRMPWLRWPMLRWAGAVAAVVIVAAAVSLRRTETRRLEVADQFKTSQSRPAETASAKTQDAVSPGPKDQGVREEAGARIASRDKAGVGASVARKQRPPVLQPPISAGAPVSEARSEVAAAVGALAKDRQALGSKKELQGNIVGGRVQGEGAPGQAGVAKTDLDNTQSAMIAQQKLPASSQAVSSANAAYGPAQNQYPEKNQAIAPAAAPEVTAQSKMKVESAPAKAARTDAAGTPPTAPPPSAEMADLRRDESAKRAVVAAPLKLQRASASASWRVSSEGALEQSIDGGSTWRPVPVQTAAGFSEASYLLTGFRAVSAVGQQVWAAGARGAVYRSDDGGATWTRVTPKTRDKLLTADVLRVEFTDARHGALTTDTGELWTTEDGGASWSVRRP